MYEYFEGEISFPKKTKDVLPLIGKKIVYLTSFDIDQSGRGYIFPKIGEVKSVYNRHIIIGDDWIPFSRMVVYRIEAAKAEQELEKRRIKFR